jgi:hypothetical protein
MSDEQNPIEVDLQIVKMEAALLREELKELERLSDELGKLALDLLKALAHLTTAPAVKPYLPTRNLYKVNKVERIEYIEQDSPIDLLVTVDGDEIEIATRPTYDPGATWSRPLRGRILQ